MKKLFIAILSAISFIKNIVPRKKEKNNNDEASNLPTSIYDYKVPALDGGEIDFADFKGKKILIVNTASKCGFTPQYDEMEKLYQDYKDQLLVVGFPANNFAGQEPGSNADIGQFCRKNYGVTFPMAAKVSVKGKDQAPIFQFLTKKELNGKKDTDILWNFTKFLIDENGNLINSYKSTVSPNGKEIRGLLG